MSLNRREFIVSLAGAAVFGPPAAVEADMADELEPFPFASLVESFSDRERRQPSPVIPTGLDRGGYLRIIDGITRFFAAHQDGRGAIIDPYELKERQYSTPAFALAVSAFALGGRDDSLVPAAVRAMEAASADLVDGRAADTHGDFFTVLLLHADRVLGRLVPASNSARWRASLRALDPAKAYRHKPTEPVLHNWNLVAAAGESLRTRDGYGATGGWIEASLAKQVGHFTPAGMYRDPSDPMAYDHFARLWALDLVEEGYKGAHSARLGALVERGAWMSLLMQSPHGQLPCGGRSAHHQWNEAEQAVTFETYARRFQRGGNPVAAGAFKRAARLSLQSISRWVRPTGELWIVKNRIDPQRRHGYESYSFHSQYNLLTAAMLAIAWLRADDTIVERASPADTGGLAFVLQPAFHKAFLSAGGYYVETDTGADLHYNPTGILRVHHRGMPPEILSDGVTPLCDYTVPAKPSRALAIGPEWLAADGQWHALAAHGAADLDQTDVQIVRADRSAVEARLRYTGRLRGGAVAVIETVMVSADGVEIRHEVEGNVQTVRQTIPALADDGLAESRIAVGTDGTVVERGGGTLRVFGSGQAVVPAGPREPCRNGFARALVVEGGKGGARCRLRVAAA